MAKGNGIHITLAEDIPATAKKDDPVKFKVSADVLVLGDKVAIAKGALVTGAIVEERKRGVAGIGGKSVTFKLIQVEAADRTLTVRAEPTKGSDHPVDSSTNGKLKSTDAVAAPAGAEYIAYIDGDQTVTVHITALTRVLWRSAEFEALHQRAQRAGRNPSAAAAPRGPSITQLQAPESGSRDAVWLLPA